MEIEIERLRARNDEIEQADRYKLFADNERLRADIKWMRADIELMLNLLRPMRMETMR